MNSNKKFQMQTTKLPTAALFHHASL